MSDNKIWFTSDWHFCHDREFIWGPRGFKNVYEMNEAIVKNYNEVVGPEDDVYMLGDAMLNDNEAGLKYIKQLKGKIHIICGNHDTTTRLEAYNNCWNVVEVCTAKYLKIKKYSFFLCHFPTMTSNLDEDKHLSQKLINLFGHTHQNTKFYKDMPTMYHVGVDSHNCYPVEFNTIIEDIRKKMKECEDYL